MGNNKAKKNIIAVVGLGYVGLPLTLAFDKAGFSVVGFDINEKKIKNLKSGIDSNEEIPKKELLKSKINFTIDPKFISESEFIIAAIPTPINEFNEPDMTLLERASELIGKNLRKGQIVIFESTVYPGVTENICAPIMEKYSNLKCGADFKIGYSPERINPGDKEHNVETIVKVVSGMDEESLKKIADLYKTICKGGIHKASSIKVAEAAKVIENIQRDLNIALMNELSRIFDKIGLDTHEVLEAAATKWNFHKFTPGLVGGHCIGVDPYYLTHLAQKLGYHPQVILAGRNINDSMAYYISVIMAKELKKIDKLPKKSKVLIMGLTFKEDVKDSRNSKSFDVINGLKKSGIQTTAHDPFLNNEDIEEYGEKNIRDFKKLRGKFDGVIICVPHKKFNDIPLKDFKKIFAENAIIIDIKGAFKNLFKNSSYIYKRL
ncbi:MAG: nucleotide sugar dehydrogenase [Patescibacteria group bacterium]